MSDLIDRQEASDALMAWEESSVWNEECLRHRGEPFWIAPSDVINQLPTAQRKKGKWTREVLGSTSGYGTTVVYQCSECESMSINKYHYCPVCGADMRGDAE